MNKTFVIAEAGVNHNGSLELAKKLVDVAVNAGADAVKFQTFKADNLVSKRARKAEYQKQTTSAEETQYEMIKRLELDEGAHHELVRFCNQKKIIFLSTPFDHESIDLLDQLGMPIFKIASGEITNLPYLRRIGKLCKEVILSTGMADLGEIEDALDVLIQSGTPKEKITVLHATTEYPCPFEEVNLRAMLTIRSAFNIKVGYSDHTSGIEVPIAAVALGASVVEKHFTLDRRMEGPDHRASLEPEELNAMIVGIRNINRALGNGIKKPTASELKNITIARKSIVATKEIKMGDTFNADNIAVKRPGNGVSPMRWDEIFGQAALRDYLCDDLI